MNHDYYFFLGLELISCFFFFNNSCTYYGNKQLKMIGCGQQPQKDVFEWGLFMLYGFSE